MRLIAYAVTDPLPALRPATHERAWMDATREKYAYRCLPLVVANSHGWEVICPLDFAATWNGGEKLEDIKITSGEDPRGRVLSHFGHGVLTFDVGYVFRTEENVNLWVTGPVNRPKDAIAPLSGIVESDWSPFTFTMNWLFTRPTTVRFEKGEPYCFFFPLVRGLVDEAEPEIHKIEEDAELAAEYAHWRDSRSNFLVDLKVPGSEAQKDKWQRKYFRGERPDGSEGTGSHQTRVRPKPFVQPKAGPR